MLIFYSLSCLPETFISNLQVSLIGLLPNLFLFQCYDWPWRNSSGIPSLVIIAPVASYLTQEILRLWSMFIHYAYWLIIIMHYLPTFLPPSLIVLPQSRNTVVGPLTCIMSGAAFYFYSCVVLNCPLPLLSPQCITPCSCGPCSWTQAVFTVPALPSCLHAVLF